MEGENFRHTGDGRACIESPPLAILIPLLVDLLGLSGAGVAQLVEHLICNQRVGGSIPSASSNQKIEKCFSPASNLPFVWGVRGHRTRASRKRNHSSRRICLNYFIKRYSKIFLAEEGVQDLV